MASAETCPLQVPADASLLHLRCVLLVTRACLQGPWGAGNQPLGGSDQFRFMEMHYPAVEPG